MKYITFLFFSVFLSVNAYTQQIQLKNPDKVVINQGVTYLADTTARFQLMDILQKKQLTQFKPVHSKAWNENITAYWLRFSVKNETDQDQEWVFDFENWSFVDFYYKDKTQYRLKKTGFLYPFRKRDYPVANNGYIKLLIKSGEIKDCLVRLEYHFHIDKTPQNLQFSITPRPVIDAKDNLIGNSIFFFLGIFVIMFIYNFFIYLSTRLKSYFYYLLVLILAFYMTAGNSGHFIALFWWIDPFAAWVSNFEFISSNIASVIYISFIQNFLQTKKRYPFWHKVLTIAIILSILFGLVLIIDFNSGFLLTSILTLGVILTILYLGIRSIKDKYPSAIYFLLGHSSLHLSIISIILVVAGILPKNDFTFTYSLPIGLTLEILFFSFAIANLINVLKRENEEKQSKIIDQLQENRLLQDKMNHELEHLVEERTVELNQSLQHLKSTQNQLIQREKMASLGELTAGIAHEIKNPLNFVNNFAEISVQLVEELEEEQAKNLVERSSELEKEIMVDLKQNLGKINHHGKRADSIVKGMLEHSLPSSGSKRLTDLNKLAKEHLTIALHGFKSKKPSFSPTLNFDLDSNLREVEIVPQEIGRVLLNIYNNAFYAISERGGKLNGNYQPGIWVSSKYKNDQVELHIKDNGVGIPKDILQKIYQPFFTTKPTGEGTGLGLSLSYDIITKGHGGDLIVETEEGNFSEFIIKLPIV